MKQYTTINAPYENPLKYFNTLPPQKTIAFLHSSIRQHYAGKYSIFGLFPIHEYQLDSFHELEKIIRRAHIKGNTYFSGGWITTFSYDLKNELEKLPFEKTGFIPQCNINCIQFGVYIFFDNENKTCSVSFHDTTYLEKYRELEKVSPTQKSVRVKSIQSNFTKKSYIKAVNTVKDYIFEGDIFEANLTRKFYGQLEKNVDGKQIFSDLIKHSPSQYSAYIKCNNFEVISSSPERFIKIKDGIINSKPIKGTRPRSNDKSKDHEIMNELQNSEKDRAENLMIVDLVRNDIGKIAKIGSVTVPELFKVESYETVHQLVSTIKGEIDTKHSIIDAIKSCFPPGSMTGAPKIRAMEICTEIEQYKRGLYSGAIGYIGFDGYVDLSVVIRTIIKNKNKFEFQVGGAIVSDSDPLEEFQETLDKAKAICTTLNIDISNI